MKTYQDVVAAVLASSPKGTSLREVLPKASAEWKRIKAGLNPTKGMASLTMKGKKDFTTKKTSKVFHRDGHFEHTGPEGEVRLPYHTKKSAKKASKRKSAKKASKKSAKQSAKLPVTEDIIIISEGPMNGGSATGSFLTLDEHRELAEATTQGDPNSMGTVVEGPGAGLGLPSAEPVSASTESSEEIEPEMFEKAAVFANEQAGGRKSRKARKGRKHRRSKKHHRK